MTSDENFPRCRATWELEDPNDEDAANGRTHVCGLLIYHAEEYHLCACGATMLKGHYSVESEPDFSRTYDEDEMVTVRRGDLRALLDVGTMSMDFGSGFLDNEQVEALRKIAVVLDVEPLAVTPANFVCQYTGEHEWTVQTGRYRETLLSIDGRRVAEEQEAKYNEIVAQLAAAKAAVRADRTPENIAALEAVKQQTLRFRSEVRASRRMLPDYETEPGEPTHERCWRCGATRPIEVQT